jgi:hypothetical protein
MACFTSLMMTIHVNRRTPELQSVMNTTSADQLLLNQNLPPDIFKIILKFAEIPRFSNTHVDTFVCGESRVHNFKKIQMDKRNRIYLLYEELQILEIYEWWADQPPRGMKTPFGRIDDFCICDDKILILKNQKLHVYDLDCHFLQILSFPESTRPRKIKITCCSSDWLVLQTNERASFGYENLWIISLKDTFAQKETRKLTYIQSIPIPVNKLIVGTIVYESELWLSHSESERREIDKFYITNGQRIHGNQSNLSQVVDMHYQHDTLFSICYNKRTDSMDMVSTTSPGRKNQKSVIIQHGAMFSNFAMSNSGFMVFTMLNIVRITK